MNFWTGSFSNWILKHGLVRICHGSFRNIRKIRREREMCFPNPKPRIREKTIQWVNISRTVILASRNDRTVPYNKTICHLHFTLKTLNSDALSQTVSLCRKAAKRVPRHHFILILIYVWYSSNALIYKTNFHLVESRPFSWFQHCLEQLQLPMTTCRDGWFDPVACGRIFIC